jgi:3-deoxy-manno-octulosonate cytidylyltransferase (CMP-KDO synthetase)|tara:strand:+ start:1496 stop:2224 length:729 start_codon:yes stop_codon:yes gene_type:complete
MKTIIIIPSRMSSTRFPDKPMALINGIPMIQRVWQQAKFSNIGPVVVACCEKEVFDLIISLGGEAIMTPPELPSGTDRVFEVIKKFPEASSFDSIINLQGDMPIINPNDIIKVNQPIIQGFDIGTLVTNISEAEEKNINVTKAKIKWIKKEFFGEALDFYKLSKNIVENIYHHVGIYSFRYATLKRFVELKPSSNEIEHKLEQWRALDAKMSIGVNFLDNVPLSVDTEEDLINVENIIKSSK